MALYLIETDEGPAVVRARNGIEACELADVPYDAPIRLKEDGVPGVIWPEPSAEPVASDDLVEDREVEITTLGDPPGTRRFKNLDTDEERTEAAPEPILPSIPRMDAFGDRIALLGLALIAPWARAPATAGKRRHSH